MQMQMQIQMTRRSANIQLTFELTSLLIHYQHYLLGGYLGFQSFRQRYISSIY